MAPVASFVVSSVVLAQNRAPSPRIRQPVCNFFNSLRVLPSLVFLFLSLPYLGLGF